MTPVRASVIPAPAPATGRPRSQRAHRAVLTAAAALFRSGGYAAASIEAIAEKSGIAKTTIYRHWPSRAAILVDVLVEEAATVAPMPEGRDPVRALRGELRKAGAAVYGLTGQLLTALLGEAQADPEVRSALVNGLFHPRTAASARAVERAQKSGVFRADVPPRLAVDLLFGPLFYRMFVGHAPVTAAFVKQVFQYVSEGLDA